MAALMGSPSVLMYTEARMPLSLSLISTALVVVEPTSRPRMRCPASLSPAPVCTMSLNDTLPAAAAKAGRTAKDLASVTNISFRLSGRTVSLSSAHRAEPSASKYPASSGMIRLGACLRRHSTITLFLLQPPTSQIRFEMFSPSCSAIRSAIISHRPATMFSFFSPLFKAWVQSLLQNTEHLPDTL